MNDSLAGRPLSVFLDELSGPAPAPGGGSVAALAGALGAALIGMVCHLTAGKPKYADVQEDMAGLLVQSERLRAELTGLIDADAEAFRDLSLAMKMPRGTEDEKAARAKAMDKAIKAATAVPMRVAEACVSVLNLCRPAAEKGNKNAISDAGVAALMAEAGLRGAALNVLINLAWIEDKTYARAAREKLEALMADKPALREEIYRYVTERL